MAKDRAAPFSRKHRRYWLTVTGFMVVIGALDLLVGFVFWPHRGDEGPPEPIKYDVKQVTGELARLIDAGVDTPDAARPPAPAPTATPR